MKKYLSLLLLLSFATFSQSKEALQTATKKLYDANFLMDFEVIKQLTYPKVYEAMGETAFLEQLENDFQNSEYRMRYQVENVPFIFSEIKIIDGKTFCVVRFRNPKRYLFENKLNAAQIATKKTWLQAKENTQNVTFEAARNSFTVRSASRYVAIFDLETVGEWKFFNIDDAFQLATFRALFDESIGNKIGI
ncbi:hypothetical protein [Flavobacterium sp.]